MPDAPVLDAPAPSAPSSLDPNAAPPAPSPSPTPSPDTSWTRDWVKDGSFDHNAFDKAPDDFKALRKELETFKTPDQLAKSYHELRALSSKKGADLLEPLPKDASPELKAARMDAIRKVNGVPEKPEGYAVEWPKELPENMRDLKGVAEFAKIAHEEGVSPAAFQKAVNLEIQRDSRRQQEQEASVKAMWEQQDALIRTAVAKEGMDYVTAKALAEKAGLRWGVDKDSPLMQNASVFMLLARLGKAGGEGKLVQGDTSDDALRQHTPETAQATLDKIRGDRGTDDWCAYWNRTADGKEKPHPRHDEVVAWAKRLSAIANANRQMRGRVG